MIKKSRHLVNTTRTSLYAAIDECIAGACLTQIGSAIQCYCILLSKDVCRQMFLHNIVLQKGLKSNNKM